VAYRNAAIAFVKELKAIKELGAEVTVRAMPTRELLAQTVRIERPTERCVTIPGRRNETAAAIAETMWVLSGRNDLEFLSRYVPRAPDYSDDGGRTWRAGYGPRLRDWHGVDQIAEILALLKRDPASRRAVVSLFDPTLDFVEVTNDVPCNNWLHFLIRDGRLDMNIVLRSNDVIWGFSGINTFEWSVLQEMVAYWLGVGVGQATFFISSLHLYVERDAQAVRVLEGWNGSTGYEKGWVASAFATEWDVLPAVISEWFEIESLIATDDAPRERIDAFEDPLLRNFLHMIELFWAKKRKADELELRACISRLGESDLAYSATEDVFRNSAALPSHIAQVGVGDGLRAAIVALHRSKDESYGNAWKRRGEQISIASNLARKVDRIETVTGGARPGDETLLDTAVDLFVYCVKYHTFLADQDQSIAASLVPGGSSPYSDGPAGFERALERYVFDAPPGMVLSEVAAEVVALFAELDQFLQSAQSVDWSSRVPLVLALTDAALRFVIVVAESDPAATASFSSTAGA
jgi:thymidylate synthase